MTDETVPVLDRPLIVVGAPRSGTTLLFELLSDVPGVWSIGTESGHLIEREFHPSTTGWESGALGAADLTDEVAAALRREFELRAAPDTLWSGIRRARRAVGVRSRPRGHPAASGPPSSGRTLRIATRLAISLPNGVQRGVRAWHLVRPVRRPIRFVEKTPENCLRVPFLAELFPDAHIVHLVRSGPPTIASLMEGWRHPTLFAGYDVPEAVRIPGGERARWAFTLVPGWRDLLDRPLEEVCAQQWISCNAALLSARDALDAPWLTVGYEDLVARPTEVLAAIGRFADLDLAGDRWRQDRLPVVNAVSEPDPEKWRREPGIERILPRIEPMMERLGYPMPSSGTSSR